MSRQSYFEDIEYTAEQTKKYLRVDDDDDQYVIRLLIEAAREYIKDAIGYCDERIARIRLLELVIISEMYEKRTMTFNADQSNSKVQYTVRSMINQLQAEDDENE